MGDRQKGWPAVCLCSASRFLSRFQEVPFPPLFVSGSHALSDSTCLGPRHQGRSRHTVTAPLVSVA
jgi:hypothetical protein